MRRKSSGWWLAGSLLVTACHADFSAPPFTAQTPISVLANPRVLPRNINLNVFDPHRKGFVCTHQASRLPPTSPEMEALLQQALAASSDDLWPDDRDYPKTVRLWEEAMGLGSWKAQINLASLLLDGAGEGQYYVSPNPVRALELIEDGMRKGWPPARAIASTQHSHSKNPVHIHAVTSPLFTAPDFV